MTNPLIENTLWQKAFLMGETMREAISNPNTDFMTKVLFDARFFQKKLGKDVSYWSNAIFTLKMLLHEKGTATEQQITKGTALEPKESSELLAYLKNMSEILEQGGKYSLNYTNLFSKIFKD